MAATKRKREPAGVRNDVSTAKAPSLGRRTSSRNVATTNPNINRDILDAPNATRASPDGDVNRDIVPVPVKRQNRVKSESPLSDAPDMVEPPKKKARGKKAAPEQDDMQTNGVTTQKEARGKKVMKTEIDDRPAAIASDSKAPPQKQDDAMADPEADGDEEADEEELVEAFSRPPPVNSDYLPLPWKGRLGYACLNTYLRQSNPPVFSSRTCRIQSILEHRHPLQDPSQPEHATKNRPDRNKPADVELGRRYLEAICLANVRDIAKMIRWNDRYGIKFLRLSSEMFPFASHPEYGYKLAPFAADELAEAGKVIAELGHRVTTHPGQFTQLGSPRQQVIDNAIRDLNYHAEMLSLLKLPEQQNRDAVMILHLGGIFEGKPETLQRFRENYAKLSQDVKNRLVLENDDMCWNVHDLLPICEELNIPMVLDFHHHNIIFDETQIREGTKDIMDLYPRIKATWDCKKIRQKMHYSEPTPAAITRKQRRKHSPRVATLPPCAPDMDLMIEAKDKEQAVFELMRAFKLPGYDSFNDIMPYVRQDDNKAALANMSKKKKSPSEPDPVLIPDHEIGMGGPENRVYWPPGMEEWLRPKKREIKPKPEVKKTKLQIQKENEKLYADMQAKRAAAVVEADDAAESDVDATPATKKAKAAMRRKVAAGEVKKAAGGRGNRGGKNVKAEESEDHLEVAFEAEVEAEEAKAEAEADQIKAETSVKRMTRERGKGNRAEKKSVKVENREDDFEVPNQVEAEAEAAETEEGEASEIKTETGVKKTAGGRENGKRGGKNVKIEKNEDDLEVPDEAQAETDKAEARKVNAEAGVKKPAGVKRKSRGKSVKVEESEVQSGLPNNEAEAEVKAKAEVKEEEDNDEILISPVRKRTRRK
ncbi:Hypothetical protein R9X50_00687500 [Acrodontium crateriforme]|uniref:UV-endonuclease UvdE n=1 Tax=Acrodontium crateriforme TaxID=150365 RepID=A0AAQ3RBU4_9PEZI|nr:Hypothetical protein R9X50_00687500 [Acrodontium crateriforme]